MKYTLKYMYVKEIDIYFKSTSISCGIILSNKIIIAPRYKRYPTDIFQTKFICEILYRFTNLREYCIRREEIKICRDGSIGAQEGLPSEWRSRDAMSVLSFSSFSSFLFLSPSLFRLLDTSPPFESISNDLKYYGKTLPPLEQFHSCPFCRTFFLFLFLMPSSLSKRRKLLTRCYSCSLKENGERTDAIPISEANHICMQ